MAALDGPAIGVRVRDERTARGWSMRWLGHKAGVSYAYISQLEGGAYPRPGIEQLGKIAAAMSLSLHQLLGVGPGEVGDLDDDAALTFLRLVKADDPAGLVRDLSLLPAGVQGDLARLIRSLAASYVGGGGGSGGSGNETGSNGAVARNGARQDQ